MFFKQLVRCPYLYESEELSLFIRPQTDVEKALTYLPKLNNQKLLEKISPFYSVMGEIDSTMIQPLNMSINNFCYSCKQNLQFLEKFKEQVNKMEKGFDSGWGSNMQLNNFFFEYERNVLSDHLQAINHKQKNSNTLFNGTNLYSSNNSEATVDQTQYILFENENKKALKDELNNLPNIMENPF
mmetsp:Transcript_1929/g.2762  ORF Transcript_1929/g.2762 Transcript_1929/m.2762 type:complete len:184 (+) Transcript_1929:1043-1594(+)